MGAKPSVLRRERHLPLGILLRVWKTAVPAGLHGMMQRIQNLPEMRHL
jgi:hypothetical protein